MKFLKCGAALALLLATTSLASAGGDEGGFFGHIFKHAKHHHMMHHYKPPYTPPPTETPKTPKTPDQPKGGNGGGNTVVGDIIAGEGVCILASQFVDFVYVSTKEKRHRTDRDQDIAFWRCIPLGFIAINAKWGDGKRCAENLQYRYPGDTTLKYPYQIGPDAPKLCGKSAAAPVATGYFKGK